MFNLLGQSVLFTVIWSLVYHFFWTHCRHGLLSGYVIESYLPMSKKKARKFVIRYLDHKRIGNKIYVDRIKLEELLKREDVESFPLD